VFVRDALPSSPSYSGATPRPRREPMLLLAAGFGMLGMIFTLGIVCGLVVSLRGKSVPDASAEQSAPVVFAAAAVAPKVEAPIAVPAPVAAAPIASEPVAAKTEVAPKEVARIEAPKAQAPKPAAPAPAKIAQSTAQASDSPRVARAMPAPAAPKPATAKKRVAMPSDPDFDAANAANDLARAQLEASLH
jgi:cytoskeletal protein RodZ